MLSAARSYASPHLVASSHDIQCRHRPLRCAACLLTLERGSALLTNVTKARLRCTGHIPVHAPLPGSFQAIASGILRTQSTFITSNRSCSESTRGRSESTKDRSQLASERRLTASVGSGRGCFCGLLTSPLALNCRDANGESRSRSWA